MNCLYFRLPDEGSTNTICLVRRVDYGSCCNGIGGYLITRWDANYDRDASFDDSYYFPIPINEELLLKLGFKKEVEDITKDKRYRLRLNGFCIDINRYSNTSSAIRCIQRPSLKVHHPYVLHTHYNY